MNTVKVTLIGESPLMVHNERMANPRDPYKIALGALTSQKKKTEDLHDQISKAEWLGGLYEKGGIPVLPADNILACLKEGARKRKLGKQVEAGVFAVGTAFPLEYDGPKDPEEMWESGKFLDYRGVGVMGKKVMRSRPRFDEWGVEIELAYDPEVISEEDLLESLRTAGQIVGIGEKRPQLGRFSVLKVKSK